MADNNQPIPSTTTSSADFNVDEFRLNARTAFERNKTTIYAVVFGLLALVGGLYFYYALYKGPRAIEADNAIFKAQYYWEIDSFQLALDGRNIPGQDASNFEGLLSVIENHGGTPAANLAHYYAGVAYLNLGDAPKAIEFLSAYKGSDGLTQAAAYGLLGDAYAENGDNSNALSYYKKAADYQPTAALSPYFLRKAGLLLEAEQKGEEAKALYERIQKEFPKAADEMGIEKDLIRVSKAY